MINTDLLPDAPKLTSLWVPAMATTSIFNMLARKLSAITLVFNLGLFHSFFFIRCLFRFNTILAFLTLVSSCEGGFAILAEFFPCVRQQRGRAIQWPSWLVRAPKNLLVLHPNVLSQPLLRGCHIFTLVTLQFLGSSRIITGNPSWRFLLLLRKELLSPPGISPKSWGAWHLIGTLTCNCLTPGVQREGEVEELALAGQHLANFHALGSQGRILFSHFWVYFWSKKLLEL